MASTYITKTPSSAGNLKTWTISLWVKFSTSNVTEYIVGGRENSSNRFYIRRSSSGALYCYSVISGSAVLEWTGTSLLRDTHGWYNLVFRQDTTQGTGADRFRVYVNGLQETLSFAHTPDQNEDLYYNKNQPTTYGSEYGSTQCFNGLMSHIHFCDGQSYAATVFGSTDSSTGEWNINTAPTMTMGSNGYSILKDGNTVTDSSTNSNDWAVGGGTLTKTEDCPSNVFATFNPLDNYWAGSTFSYGNTKVLTGSSSYAANLSTLGASTGKFYAEFKCTDEGRGYPQVGIKGKSPTAISDGVSNGADSVCYYGLDGKKLVGGSASTYGATYGTGDIIGVAMDLTNNRIFFSKNSVWQDSGDPTSSTGAITIPTSSSGFYFMGVDDEDNGGTNIWEANFGNGYFGTTAVSSAGTNASGNGIFEYDVPTGYTALSTKGLNL